MLQATHRKDKQNKGRVKYVRIVRDALALGVDRTHLYRVLTGERQSRSLLRRYRELKRDAA